MFVVLYICNPYHNISFQKALGPFFFLVIASIRCHFDSSRVRISSMSDYYRIKRAVLTKFNNGFYAAGVFTAVSR